ncbi:type I-B CRISPR-associated protein Cas7/Cst2/DevR [Clostridium prolinivorans]|uniref:type I-B CRISPR-associated protein Cas7/Cst2/DevR n=1 Tax=Clostridium prolinivorans TaxID=2769420 RepID=UPI000FDADAFD|nr:type I-B CRISPR-associated protein Cas7/Cst2/DevR [Clostridium prolinivorans]
MKEFTHIAGTFLIEADGSFLNGAGLGDGEDRNVTVPKTLVYKGEKAPYVSAQAWKRWLRNTLIEETGWDKSELKAIGANEKGNTNKIAGELNPVEFVEDDIFGYMEAKGGQGKETEEEGKKTSGKTRALIRTSPFMASILLSLRKRGWKTVDEGFVHLKEGTPQPYSTMFYTTDLQGIFCLDYGRLGVFNNCGDRIELDENKVEKFIKDGLIEEIKVEDEKKNWKVYALKNLNEERKKRAGELLKALSVLRGGAKQAAFGTDLAPKAIILAPLNCGNPIFNSLFIEEKELLFKTETFKEVLRDYKDRITGNVYIGIRKGYIKNEQEIYDISSDEEFKDLVVVTSPIDAVKKFNERELGYK